MAKDKRRTMSTDLNDIELTDTDAMTDQEQASLFVSLTNPAKKSSRQKKSM